jgi:FHA domain
MNIPISKREYTFGRTANMNDIHLDSKKVSQKHAKVSYIDTEQLLLEDLNSSNGTYVNDEQIKTKLVSISDIIKMGDKQFALSDFFRIDIDKKQLEFRGLGTNDFTREFLLLKPIAEKYFEDVAMHGKKNEQVKFWRSTIMFVVTPSITALGGLLALMESPIAKNHIFQFFCTVPALVSGYLYLTGESPKTIEKTKQVRKSIDNDFRKKYVCPKCKAPLPINKTWEEVAAYKVHNSKEHPCGAIWVK